MTNQANQLFRNINNMSPKTGGGGEGGMTITEKVKQILDDIMEKCAPMACLSMLLHGTFPLLRLHSVRSHLLIADTTPSFPPSPLLMAGCPNCST